MTRCVINWQITDFLEEEKPRGKRNGQHCTDVAEISLFVVVSEVNMVRSNPREWWIDTWGTRHICPDKGLFTNFKLVHNGKTLFTRNLAMSTIEYQGKIILKMTYRKELTLNNVIYVSDIRKNLLS